MASTFCRADLGVLPQLLPSREKRGARSKRRRRTNVKKSDLTPKNQKSKKKGLYHVFLQDLQVMCGRNPSTAVDTCKYGKLYKHVIQTLTPTKLVRRCGPVAPRPLSGLPCAEVVTRSQHTCSAPFHRLNCGSRGCYDRGRFEGF